MPEGHDATIEVCNIMSFVLYTQILKQSVLKPASPGITLIVMHNFAAIRSAVLEKMMFEVAIFRNFPDISRLKLSLPS